MGVTISYTESPDESRFYIPNGGDNAGIIDVVTQMPWTLSPYFSRLDVPRMHLTEYQQSTGQLIASVIYFSRTFDGITLQNATDKIAGKANYAEVYKNKYFAKPTGFKYILPYFSEVITSRTNGFDGGGDDSGIGNVTALLPDFLTGSKIGTGFNKIKSIGDDIMKAANTVMSGKINFEFPKRWDSTTTETYTTTFDLLNTITHEETKQNRKFCHLLTYQNTPSRRNFAIVDPPTIYSMRIPGVVDLPVCYIQDLKITNLGSVRQMNIDGVLRNIPEAYRISIILNSLLMPTRNLMLGTESGTSVEAISDFTEYQKMIDEIAKKFTDAASEVFTGNTSTIQYDRYNDKY